MTAQQHNPKEVFLVEHLSQQEVSLVVIPNQQEVSLEVIPNQLGVSLEAILNQQEVCLEILDQQVEVSSAQNLQTTVPAKVAVGVGSSETVVHQKAHSSVVQIQAPVYLARNLPALLFSVASQASHYSDNKIRYSVKVLVKKTIMKKMKTKMIMETISLKMSHQVL